MTNWSYSENTTGDIFLPGNSEAVSVSLAPGDSEMIELALRGDVNGDGYVGGTDLTAIVTNWGTNPATRAQGDLSGDGTVGGLDYNEVITYWGTGIPLPPEAPSEPVATGGLSNDQTVLQAGFTEDAESVSGLASQEYQSAAASWLYHRKRGLRKAKGIQEGSRFESANSKYTNSSDKSIISQILSDTEGEHTDFLSLLQFKRSLDI